ncbi:MAG: NAD(P)H-dependent oxidoreductase [Moritella sp.]|uniref:FMN-dependent NADH-azoreductase n=1 Tax=Moritella sp. TaxID=78556 RepID=UPI001D1FD3A2|nr:NAD(P)H-dependent oxidoreductase [Moritella sp.]NQZ50055.1 NAD(P)H-dependent oxidoreductase [Moritella sp.]
MKNILFVESSPRKEKSITSDVCQKVIRNLQIGGDYIVDHVDLWDVELPPMNGDTLDAKYAIFSGQELTAQQQASWFALTEHIDRFAAADLVIIAAPTWIWGIPYVLKHYIDVVTQPQLTFNWTPEDGFTSLLKPRNAVLVTSSGGDYTLGSGNEDEDFVIKYLKLWLKTCMGCELKMINMTLSAAGEEELQKSYVQADEKIDEICNLMNSVEALI